MTMATPGSELTPMVHRRMTITSTSWITQVYEKWKKVDAHSMREIEVEMCEMSLAFEISVRALPLILNALRSARGRERQ